MYEVADPKGDLLITLLPITSFIPPWEEELARHAPNLPETTTTASDDFLLATANLHLLDIQGLVTDNEMDQYQLHDYGADLEYSEYGHVRIKSSSEVLCDASAHFKVILTGPWLEATKIYEDGLRHIDIECFDLDAFRILIHTIHNWYCDPDLWEMDLNLLLNIALLVDELQCKEAVQWAVREWRCAANQRSPVSNTEDPREMTIWMFIAYALDLEALNRLEPLFQHPLDTTFKDATYAAMTRSKGPIPTLGLPFPKEIITGVGNWDVGSIAFCEDRRREGIRHLLDVTRLLLKGECRHVFNFSTWAHCGSPDCLEVIRSTAERELKFLPLLNAGKDDPFLGWSYKEIFDALDNLKIPKMQCPYENGPLRKWYAGPGGGPYEYYCHQTQGWIRWVLRGRCFKIMCGTYVPKIPDRDEREIRMSKLRVMMKR